jgi:5-methylthioadenosine/S-adenosylhomocysteine deaminase
MLKETNTPVAHCPTSNAKIGNGVARVPDLLDAGVTVGVGHDAATANNNLDLFETMKFATLLQRVVKLSPSILPPTMVLGLATRNGGKALNLTTGIIKPGYKADIILLNLRHQHFTPLVFGEDFNLLSHLVYAAHGEDVDTTIINGKVIMENRQIKTINELQVIDKANEAFHTLYSRLDKTWHQ